MFPLPSVVVLKSKYEAPRVSKHTVRLSLFFSKFCPGVRRSPNPVRCIDTLYKNVRYGVSLASPKWSRYLKFSKYVLTSPNFRSGYWRFWPTMINPKCNKVYSYASKRYMDLHRRLYLYKIRYIQRRIASPKLLKSSWRALVLKSLSIRRDMSYLSSPKIPERALEVRTLASTYWKSAYYSTRLYACNDQVSDFESVYIVKNFSNYRYSFARRHSNLVLHGRMAVQLYSDFYAMQHTTHNLHIDIGMLKTLKFIESNLGRNVCSSVILSLWYFSRSRPVDYSACKTYANISFRRSPISNFLRHHINTVFGLLKPVDSYFSNVDVMKIAFGIQLVIGLYLVCIYPEGMRGMVVL